MTFVTIPCTVVLSAFDLVAYDGGGGYSTGDEIEKFRCKQKDIAYRGFFFKLIEYIQKPYNIGFYNDCHLIKI